MKKLYCFDFDGTLTKKDTMFLFLKFVSPSKFRFQFLRHIPLFVLFKLKLASAEKVKQSLISAVIGGLHEKTLREKADAFFEKNYPALIRQNALDFLKTIDPAKTEMLLVTASLDIWARPFAEKFGMKLVSTKAEFKNGLFTGNFATPNCNGKEKVVRIQNEIQDKKFDKRIAFGDTDGDKPMLAWADEGHFRFFN